MLPRRQCTRLIRTRAIFRVHKFVHIVQFKITRFVYISLYGFVVLYVSSLIACMYFEVLVTHAISLAFCSRCLYR